MISKISICYLLKFNRGSEWMLGENVFKTSRPNEVIFTSLHQIKDSNKPYGQIGSIAFFRKEGVISVIGIPSFFKIEPRSPWTFRIDYLFWVIRVYKIILKKKWDRRLIYHNNFAQVLTPIPKNIRQSENFIFGPVGGLGPYYKCIFLHPKYRLFNFFVFQILYSLISKRIQRMNTILIHPILGEKFNVQNILPAIALDKETSNPKSIRKHQIIHVSRFVYFKLPNLHREIFYRLALLNPDIHFKIIGSGWKKEFVLDNFEIVGPVKRDQVLKIFEESSYHINLSLELAGFVNLESALAKCITIGAKDTGSHFLLDLDSNHCIDLYSNRMSVNDIVRIISNRIRVYDDCVASKQFVAAQRFSVKNLKSQYRKVNRIK